MFTENILVTGASGLLGSSLVSHLKIKNYSVVTQGRIKKADFLFDLTDKLKSFEILNRIRPKIIINLVGLTSVDLCEQQMNLAYQLNTLTIENLVNWIEVAGVDCYLVQVSTDHVYDCKHLNKEENVVITNNYAFSKYAGELAALRVPSSVLRTNFVGLSKLKQRETLTDWVYNSLVNKLTVQAFQDIYFSPLSIKALVEMIEIVIRKKPIGIFNLGSNEGMSKADFLFTFANILKLQTKTMSRIESSQVNQLRAYRPKNMMMDSSKFENLLGVKLPKLENLIQSLAREYYEQT